MTCVLRAIVLTTGGGQVETTAVGTVSAGRETDTHNVWNPARRCKNQKKSAATSNGTKDGPNNTQSTAKSNAEPKLPERCNTLGFPHSRGN